MATDVVDLATPTSTVLATVVPDADSVEMIDVNGSGSIVTGGFSTTFEEVV